MRRTRGGRTALLVGLSVSAGAIGLASDPAAAAAVVNCTLDPATGRATATVSGADVFVTLNVQSGNVVVTAFESFTPGVAASCGATTSIQTVRVNGDNFSQTVFPTPLPGGAVEGDGANEIEVEIALGAGDDGIQFSPQPGVALDVRIGANGLNLDASTSTDAEVTLLSGVEGINAIGGALDDRILAIGGLGTGGGWTGRLSLHGEGGNDTLQSFRGSTIDGGDDNDVLRGGAGADTLNGGDGNDTVTGGDGADVFLGSFGLPDGADRYDGGPGLDFILVYASRALGVRVNQDGFATDGTIAGPGVPAEGDNVTGMERVDGSNGDDILLGTSGADQLHGYGGADRINGLGGSDSLFGDDGNDTLTANDGLADSVDGGNDIDSCTCDPIDVQQNIP
jgi:Ca2+-binding RTX toxin-like protein